MPQDTELITTLTPYITLAIGFIFGLIGTIIGVLLNHRLHTKQSAKQKQRQLYAEFVSLHDAIVNITTHSAMAQINCDYYNRWRDLLMPGNPGEQEASENLKSWQLFSSQVELTRIQIYTKFYETVVSLRTTFPYTAKLVEHVKECYAIKSLNMEDSKLKQVSNHKELDIWLREKDSEISNIVKEQISRPISECIAFLMSYIIP